MMQWYVIHSKPHKESFLLDQLLRLDIEAYSPLLPKKTDQPQKQRKPYFPGYLFVHLDLELTRLSSLTWVPGSSGVVCFGGEPASLPDQFIVSMKRHESSLLFTNGSIPPRFKQGQSLMISGGIFEGYRAIFDEYLPGKERARILLISISNRAMMAEISTQVLTD